MNNLDLGKLILEQVGGSDNIQNATHCMTRLRMNIKNNELVNVDALKAIDGVLGVVVEDTLQVVIGPGRAKKVYDLLVAELGVNSKSVSWEENKDAIKSTQKESPLKQFIKTVSDIFIPLIPALIASGLFNGFASLIGQMVSPTDGFWFITMKLFQLFGSAFLAYFAIYTGINSAKQFGGNEGLGGMIGAMSIAPGLIDVSKFLGFFNEESPLDSILTTGKGGIIGVIAGVYLMTKVEKFIRKALPDVLDLAFTSFFTILITGVIFVVGIMPAAGFISDVLVTFLNVFINSPNPVVNVISGFILAGLFLPMVLLGLHHGLIPIYAIQLEKTGGVSLFPVLAMAGAGQVGASIAIYIKAKKAGNKSLTSIITGALPAGFLGIGEPLIYGVTLPLGKPFITAGIGAGFGGAFIMLTKVTAVAWGPSGLVAIALMGSPASMLNFFIGLVISYVAGFVITYFTIKETDVA